MSRVLFQNVRPIYEKSNLLVLVLRNRLFNFLKLSLNRKLFCILTPPPTPPALFILPMLICFFLKADKIITIATWTYIRYNFPCISTICSPSFLDIWLLLLAIRHNYRWYNATVFTEVLHENKILTKHKY